MYHNCVRNSPKWVNKKHFLQPSFSPFWFNFARYFVWEFHNRLFKNRLQILTTLLSLLYIEINKNAFFPFKISEICKSATVGVQSLRKLFHQAKYNMEIFKILGHGLDKFWINCFHPVYSASPAMSFTKDTWHHCKNCRYKNPKFPLMVNFVQQNFFLVDKMCYRN